jgi:predicted RNA-binding protein YlxR (DUF448 family)
MCVACRQRAPQPALLRLSAGPSGRLQAEAWPRRGRGAYVCPGGPCLDRALHKQAVRRALRLPKSVELPTAEQIRAQIRERLGARLAQLGPPGAKTDLGARTEHLLIELGERPSRQADGRGEDRLTVDGARRFSKVAHRADSLGRKGGPANAHG